jgi:hypothetical protein
MDRSDFPLSVLDGTIITSTRRNGESVTLLTVQPGSPPPRLTLVEWRAWVAADHERMIQEFERWVGRGVLARWEADGEPGKTSGLPGGIP